MALRRIPAQPQFADPTLNRFAEQTIAALKEAGEGGVASLNYAAPVGLSVGGGNVLGASDDVVRADHKHALPAFGTTAGTFAEGNDARFGGQGPWDARVVPSGLDTTSDEFTADTIGSGKWLDWDPGAFVTHTVDTTRRGMTAATIAGVGNRWCARYQAPPSATFTVAVWVSGDGAVSDTTSPFVGLAFGNDWNTSPTTADASALLFCVQRSGAPSAVLSHALTAYNVAGTSSNIRETVGSTGLWLRVRVSGGAWTHEYSQDGLHWVQIGPTTAFTFGGVNQMGLIYGNVIATPQQAIYKHFRVWNGVAGPYDAYNGGYL